MNLIVDIEITNLVTQKMMAGMRKQLIALSTKHSSDNKKGIGSTIAGMKMIVEVSDEKFDILYARLDRDVFIFSLKDWSRDKWRDEIRDLAIATPRKLLVKMVSERLYRLIEFHNVVRSERVGVSGSSHPGKHPGAKGAITIDMVGEIPDLNNRTSIEKYKNNHPKSSTKTYLYSQAMHSVEKLLKREDVTDGILTDAWNQAIAMTVMKS
jgi:hypothetical protein